MNFNYMNLFHKYADLAIDNVIKFGSKVVLAIIFWLIGRFVIKTIINIVHSKLEDSSTDKTFIRYLRSVTSIILEILLIVALFGFMGVQTTTFAALIAASGVAIAMAWSGLLSNFAAGTFIMFLRPFKVGDTVCVCGNITGEIVEIGLFTTSINTFDNILTLVGNNKIFTDVIQNFTSNGIRRVNLTVQLAPDTDPAEISNFLKERVSKVENILDTPALDVTIVEFNVSGTLLAVRPYCKISDYAKVYADTAYAIREIVKDKVNTVNVNNISCVKKYKRNKEAQTTV